MRVAYLYQYFNTPKMPGGSRAYEMARRLVARGHEVHVITTLRDSNRADGWQTTVEDGVNVHWLAVPYGNEMSASRRVVAFIRFAIAAGPRAITTRPDVVFATSTPLTIAVPGILARWWCRVPMVFEVRDLWPDVPIAMGVLRNPVLVSAARLLEWCAYLNASRVIALSPGMMEGVIRAGFPRERVHVIPNAADIDSFGAVPPDAPGVRDLLPTVGEGPIVLYAGTLGRVNRVDYLVSLAAEMPPEARAQFVIIGGGSEAEFVERRAAEIGVLNKNVHMLARQPKHLMPGLFASSDVVVSVVANSPALLDNSANKFFDGLAAGRPVAINYRGWQAELLEETGAGFVLDRDVERAAVDLSAWLQDSQRLEAAGRAARRLAETRFSRDLLADQLEKVLVSVVS